MEANSDNVVIEVDGLSFITTRSLLVKSSEYFNAMFGSNKFLETNKKEISIMDIDGKAFEAILHWCENKQLGLEEKDITEVLRIMEAASMLLFNELKVDCVKSVEERLDCEHCLIILEAADRLGLLQLLHRSKEMATWRYNMCRKSIVHFDNASTSDGTRCIPSLSSLHSVLCLPDTFSARDQDILDDFKKVAFCQKNQSDGDSGEATQSLLKQLIISQWDTLAYVMSNMNDQPSQEEKKRINKKLALFTDKLGSVALSGPKPDDLSAMQDNELWAIADDLFSDSYARGKLTYPCVIGYEFPVSLTSTDADFRTLTKWKTPVCYAYSPRSKCLSKILDMTVVTKRDENCIRSAVGFRVTGCCGGFLLSGGEYEYGRNVWNNIIWRYQYQSDSWQEIQTLQEPRRHHTAVLIGEELFLLGGFNTKRVMLDTVTKININTGVTTDCCPLSYPMFKIAAVVYQREILVIHQNCVHIYSPESDRWSQRNIVNHPPSVEFVTAVVYNDEIFLTALYSNKIFRLEPVACELSEWGSFKQETMSVCLVGSHLYNFHTDEFGDGSWIEAFELTDKKRETVWSHDEGSPFHGSFSTAASIGAVAITRT